MSRFTSPVGGGAAGGVTSVNTRDGDVTGVADLAAANIFTAAQSVEVINFNSTNTAYPSLIPADVVIKMKTITASVSQWYVNDGKSAYTEIKLSGYSTNYPELINGNYYALAFPNQSGMSENLIYPNVTSWLYQVIFSVGQFTAYSAYAQPTLPFNVIVRQRIAPIIMQAETTVFAVNGNGSTTVNGGLLIKNGADVTHGTIRAGGGTARTPSLVIEDRPLSYNSLGGTTGGALESYNSALYYTQFLNNGDSNIRGIVNTSSTRLNSGGFAVATGGAVFGSSNSRMNPQLWVGKKYKYKASIIYTKSSSGTMSFGFTENSYTFRCLAQQTTYIAGGGLAYQSSVYARDALTTTQATSGTLAAGTYHTTIEGFMYTGRTGAGSSSLYLSVALSAGTITLLEGSYSEMINLGPGEVY